MLETLFPGSLCGNRKFQQMSLFFLWTVVLGRILTVDNLWRAFSLFGVHWVLKGLMWGIWSERSIHDLKLSFFHTLFEWTNALEVFTFTSMPDLLDNCTFHTSQFFFFFGFYSLQHIFLCAFGLWLIVFTHLFFLELSVLFCAM